MRLPLRVIATSLLAAASTVAIAAQTNSGQAPIPKTATLEALHQRLDQDANAVLPKVVALRRLLHQHPELGNREVQTSKLLADRLRALGYEVQTGVAKTGVVAILHGGKPGPVVALRSDIDALPVTEETGLPFASTERAQFNGREVGVMHACGHDFHMAMLMGAAEVLAGLKADLPGTVKLIFQPAEEGAPAGEEGGADLMVKEGVLENPKVDAIFGLHVGITPLEAGSISFRPRGIMAASDSLSITVHGRSTHGAMPWAGVDPIVVSAQIVLGLQTIISRQADLTTAPAVITVGTIEGGNRSNIVPDEVRLTGTIRTFDADMQKKIHEGITRTVEHIAAAAGAKAEVTITIGNSVTYNDPALTDRMTPSLRRVAAGTFNPNAQVTTGAEDFSAYQKQVPGLYFFLGIAPKGTAPASWAANHSPRFNPDESALITGVRALASVAVDYLAGPVK
ncbi:MAG: amidohydrolase [Acidobacteria bacterium]|nr:amidohydrolase [Acidobacteriota bacterium]